MRLWIRYRKWDWLLNQQVYGAFGLIYVHYAILLLEVCGLEQTLENNVTSNVWNAAKISYSYSTFDIQNKKIIFKKGEKLLPIISVLHILLQLLSRQLHPGQCPLSTKSRMVTLSKTTH